MIIMLQESQRLNRMAITPSQVDRLFINIYSLIIHLEISIQNISLVLSCEPQSNCRLKATDNCINTMRNVSNPCNYSYKHRYFLPGGNNTSRSLMFLSLKLDIGGDEPTINHSAPSWSYNLLLGQSNRHNGEDARILKNENIKVNQVYYSSQTEHNLIIHRIPANTAQQNKN